MKTLPLSEVKAKLSQLVDEVESRDARVVITRRGRPAAVLVSNDDLESWQETVEITSDPELMAQIRAGQRDLKEGRASRLSEAELDGLLGPPAKKRSPTRSVQKGRPSPRRAR